MTNEEWRYDTAAVLLEIMYERERQVAKYGHNDDLANGTGKEARWARPVSEANARTLERSFRAQYELDEERNGKPTWVNLVREELAEAFQEDDPELLAGELVQVAALCVSWMETLSRTKLADDSEEVQGAGHSKLEGQCKLHRY